jgi:hypothetical protein
VLGGEALTLGEGWRRWSLPVLGARLADVVRLGGWCLTLWATSPPANRLAREMGDAEIRCLGT